MTLTTCALYCGHAAINVHAKTIIQQTTHISTDVYSARRRRRSTYLYSCVNWGAVERTKTPKLGNSSKTMKISKLANTISMIIIGLHVRYGCVGLKKAYEVMLIRV